MNRKDELREAYEDALFALLMYDVAEHEGARLLEENERLKNDENAAVPESLDRKCRATIRRYFLRRRILYVLKVVSAFIVSALAAHLLCGVYMASRIKHK